MTNNQWNNRGQGVNASPFAGVQQQQINPTLGGFPQAQSKTTSSAILTSAVKWGLIGGVVGFFLQEIVPAGLTLGIASVFGGYNSTNIDFLFMLQYGTLFVAPFSFGLGLCLGIGEAVSLDSKDGILKYGIKGAFTAGLVGVLTGIFGQLLYSLSTLSLMGTLVSHSLFRGACWAFVGLGIGVSVGFVKPPYKKVFKCAIGGALGGLVGGFVFDFLFEMGFTFGPNDDGILTRLVGLVILGVAIGLGIGLCNYYKNKKGEPSTQIH
ncbi:hypothetical protein FACS1894125_2510 [Actinomycetota bacterium]|nr:hypothetical protein FACS1894125_2510 [Actinomycetota bacterium]